MLKHKVFVMSILAMLLIVGTANAQLKIAVLDFKAGVGVAQSEVDGIADMLNTFMFSPQDFILIERTQINKVIQEQGFQASVLTESEMIKIGQILNVQKIIIGTINDVRDQYNIDIRAIDVQTGSTVGTAGEMWAKGTSYRDVMKKIAATLLSQIKPTPNTSPQTSSSSPSPIPVVTLYGYLHVFPEDIGEFANAPSSIINSVNRNVTHGYNDWRLPTIEELRLIRGQASKIRGLLNDGLYLSSENAAILSFSTNQIVPYQANGRVRLVSTGKLMANINLTSQQINANTTSNVDIAALRNNFELSDKAWSNEMDDLAIEYAKKAVDILPSHYSPYKQLGFIYYRKGNYQESVSNLSKAIMLLDENNFQSLYDICGYRGSWDSSYEEAIGYIYYLIAGAYGYLEDYQKAISFVLKEGSIKNDYASGFYKAGYFSLLAGDYSSAESYLKNVLELPEANTDAWPPTFKGDVYWLLTIAAEGQEKYSDRKTYAQNAARLGNEVAQNWLLNNNMSW